MMNFPEDIKAEVSIDLISSNKPSFKYLVQYLGRFTGNYERDILNYFDLEKHFQNPDFEEFAIIIKLNRNGFYKSLPEALFHDCNRFAKSRHLDPTDFKREYQKQKDEIEFAKKFFLPFENILFKYRIKIERKVNETIYKSFNILKEYFPDISSEVSHQSTVISYQSSYLKRLSLLIPYASFIKGDVSRIIFSLRFLLNTEINFKSGMKKTRFSCKEIGLGLGLGLRLGENMVCGKDFYEENYTWSFLIVLDDEMISNYFNDNRFTLLLEKYFTDYFIPQNIDINYKIKCEESLDFQLGKTNDSTNRYLGYNVIL